MSNKEIAAVFREVADLLEITKRGNPFEIRAYQMAAEKIEHLPYSLIEILKKEGEKGLRGIEGIGRSLASHIIELIKTKKLKKFEDLKKQVPPAELELLDIPAVGPRLAQKIYQLLGIKSIAGLKQKLSQKDALAKLAEASIKEKMVEKILAGIDFIAKSEGRILLGEAEPIAREIIDWLKQQKEVKSADVVGSLRRRKETIGDIDLIACLKPPFEKQSENFISNFCQASLVKKIIAQGETKASIITRDNIQVDLEIVPVKEYGSLLQHFTGSKEHNIALRSYAVSKGMSISEHGIKVGSPFAKATEGLSSQKEKIIRCGDERKVYSTLGMEYILPELRENQGEIEAALKYQLPRLVEYTDIKGDLQIHSDWSDGEATIEELAEKAKKSGYQYILITDHSRGLGITHGLDEKRILEQMAEIDKVNQKLGGKNFRVLKGIEVNINALGNLDLPDEILKKLDIVVGSLHSSLNAPKDRITERLLRAMENPHLDIIGHPSGRIINKRPESTLDWPKVFRASQKTNTFLEINASFFRLDLKDIYIREAKKYGLKFALGTDAHSVKELDFMHFGIAQARRGWLEKKDIINCLNLGELYDFKRRTK